MSRQRAGLDSTCLLHKLATSWTLLMRYSPSRSLVAIFFIIVFSLLLLHPFLRWAVDSRCNGTNARWWCVYHDCTRATSANMCLLVSTRWHRQTPPSPVPTPDCRYATVHRDIRSATDHGSKLEALQNLKTSSIHFGLTNGSPPLILSFIPTSQRRRKPIFALSIGRMKAFLVVWNENAQL